MSAPLCHYCTATAMIEKTRVPQGNGKWLAIYQCDQCKRIEAVTE